MISAAIRFLSLVLLAPQIGAAAQDAVAEAARGTALAREGKYDLAIEHYKAALRLDSHLPGLYLNLGLAYFKSKRLPEAAAAFEEAVRADSGSFQARALLGMSYYGSGRYREAAAQLKLASEAQPDNLELRYTLAQSYLWIGTISGSLARIPVSALEEPGFRARSHPSWRGARCVQPDGGRDGGVRGRGKSIASAARRPLRAGVSLLETAALRGRLPRVRSGTGQSAAARASLDLPGRRGNAHGARTGRPRRIFDARWHWMRICGSHTWTWASFSPQRTIPAKRPPFSRGDSDRSFQARCALPVGAAVEFPGPRAGGAGRVRARSRSWRLRNPHRR